MTARDAIDWEDEDEDAPARPTIAQSKYLGASRAPALFGVDEFGKTPLEVWAETTGRVERDESEPASPQEVGLELERPVLRLYCRKLGISESSLTFPGTLLHSLYPEIGATPDAMRGEKRIVQVKVVGIHNAKKWGPDGDPDGVPPGVLVQTQHEMAVTSADVCDVVALVGTDVRVFPVERNQIMIRDMLDVEREWWARYVVGDEMPDPFGADGDVLRKIFPREREGMRLANGEEEMLVDALVAAKLAQKEAEAVREDLQARVCAAIGDGLGLTLEDGRVVTWKANKSGGIAWKDYAIALRTLVEERGIAADKKLLERIEREYERDGARVLRTPKGKT